MSVIFLGAVFVCYWAEAHGNDLINALGLTGGNMEGKEVRFGIANSALCGGNHRCLERLGECHARQLHPLGGMIPMA